MSRRRREKREQRRAALSQPVAVAAPPSQRSTFRVAQAQRVLAETLPDVVRNSTRDRVKPSARRSVSPAPLSAAGSGQQSPRNPPRRSAPEKAGQRAQSTLDRPRNCKPRPDGSKPKGGSGPSRAFVPWCK